MEVSTRLGSAQGGAVRAGALRSGWAVQDPKNVPGGFSLAYFSLAVQREVMSPSRAKLPLIIKTISLKRKPTNGQVDYLTSKTKYFT